MLKNYLKTTIRNLWRNRTYSFLNIFGLAIGITCAGLIFLWVEDELTFDNNHIKKNELFQVMENQFYAGKIYTFASTPGPLSQGMRTEIPGVVNSTRTSWQQNMLFSLNDKSIYENGYMADSNIFSMLTVQFVQGKQANVFKDNQSVVISEKMAKKFFGEDSNIIGKAIKVDNKENFIVTGVVKDMPKNSSLQFDWVVPFQNYLDKNDWLKEWGNNGIQTFAELSPNTSLAAVNKKIDGYIKTKESSSVVRLFLLSMNDWRLRNNFEEGKQTGGRIIFVRMFSVIAWIILLIACINFMNLATARSEKRAREVGVRKVLGAGKKMLIGQFIGEALFMSLLAVLFSLLLLMLLLPSFNTLVEKQLTLGLWQPSHLIALGLIVLICGLVAGSYPALYLSSFNPVYVFKGMKMKGGSASFVRKGLVVLQFTISIVLIVSTIIIFQQIQHVKNRDLGYNKDNLIQMNVQGDIQKKFPAVRQELLATGYVENAALSSLGMLWMGSSSSNYSWQGKDPNKKILITQDGVDPEYLPTTGLQLKYGRNFSSVAAQDSMSFIINETLAKLIGKENPVGEIIKQDTTPFRIVGVVKDFVYGDMYGKSDPLIFYCKPEWAGNIYIKLKNKSQTEAAVAKIEKVMKANNPGFPFDYQFVDAQFNRQFNTETLISKLSRVFAALAIIISCLGLFGLAAYTAERRTKEIGIRKVLGASVSRITGLLSKDFLQLVLISALIAFPLSWWAMHQWLQNYAYRITISWWVFVVAGVMAMLIALLTISFQAIRAALSNPIINLRTE